MQSPDRTPESTLHPPGLQALYPEPHHHALEGLYLSSELRRCVSSDSVYIYSNFITSLDGRVAVANKTSGELSVPQDTANPRDWRLLLELAAPADAIIVSGRYMRQLDEGKAQALPPFDGEVPQDITAFRDHLGLAPHPTLVIVSNSLDLPRAELCRFRHRTVIVVTSKQAAAAAVQQLTKMGVIVVRAGESKVEGAELVAALKQQNLNLVYSIAGPAVLHTLLEGRVLQRLYLTTVLRALGGVDYATMAKGAGLDPPFDFELAALYLDHHGPGGVQQLLQVFDRRK